MKGLWSIISNTRGESTVPGMKFYPKKFISITFESKISDVNDASFCVIFSGQMCLILLDVFLFHIRKITEKLMIFECGVTMGTEGAPNRWTEEEKNKTNQHGHGPRALKLHHCTNRPYVKR